MRKFTTFVQCILHMPKSQLPVRRVHCFVQEIMYRFFF